MFLSRFGGNFVSMEKEGRKNFNLYKCDCKYIALKNQLAKSGPKKTRGWKVPSLMPIRGTSFKNAKVLTKNRKEES